MRPPIIRFRSARKRPALRGHHARLLEVDGVQRHVLGTDLPAPRGVPMCGVPRPGGAVTGRAAYASRRGSVAQGLDVPSATWPPLSRTTMRRSRAASFRATGVSGPAPTMQTSASSVVLSSVRRPLPYARASAAVRLDSRRRSARRANMPVAESLSSCHAAHPSIARAASSGHRSVVSQVGARGSPWWCERSGHGAFVMEYLGARRDIRLLVQDEAACAGDRNRAGAVDTPYFSVPDDDDELLEAPSPHAFALETPPVSDVVRHQRLLRGIRTSSAEHASFSTIEATRCGRS